MANQPHRPHIFIDTDVLFAGAASPTEHSASLELLGMAEKTLVEAITSEQVITEVKWKLEKKLPNALPAFQMLVSRCMHVVSDPTMEEVQALSGTVDSKNPPILSAVVREGCIYLASYDIQHFQPGVKSITVRKPGKLVLKIRYLLARMTSD